MASHLFEGTPVKRQPLNCGDLLALVAADRELVDVAARPLDELHEPRAALGSFSGTYDLCLIDTAPTLGNPLYAACMRRRMLQAPTLPSLRNAVRRTELYLREVAE